MFRQPIKLHNFSKFKIGDRVMVMEYGSSESIGTIVAMSSVCGCESIHIDRELHFDPYQRSKGIKQSSGRTVVGEIYERPIKLIGLNYGKRY